MKIGLLIPDRGDRTEVWKDISGYKGLYQISSLGNIRSTSKTRINKWKKPYKISGKLLKPSLRGGYRIIVLYQGDVKRKTFAVSRLVAQAFIPNPKNKPEVNHKDGIRINDFYKNLEWSTKSENVIHSYSVLHRYASNFGKNNNLPISVRQVDKKTRKVLNRFRSMTKAQDVTGISRHHIGKCIKGKRKLAGGFLWLK